MSVDTEGFDKETSGIGEMYAEIVRLRRLIRDLVSSLAAITGNGTRDTVIVSDAIEAAEAALEKS